MSVWESQEECFHYIFKWLCATHECRNTKSGTAIDLKVDDMPMATLYFTKNGKLTRIRIK